MCVWAGVCGLREEMAGARGVEVDIGDEVECVAFLECLPAMLPAFGNLQAIVALAICWSVEDRNEWISASVEGESMRGCLSPSMDRHTYMT